MFSRLVRVIKSWLGFFISYAEDPEVMLQESIEEMRNTLPKLNQILVTTRATEIRLEQDLLEAQRKERSLIASIKTALADGSPEARRLAEDDAATLQQVRLEVQSTTEQLETAKQAFENAKLSVDDIKEKLRARIEQARKAIAESKKAEVMRSAANALAELDTYGTAATTDKYLDQIRQKVAESKASVEVATGGLDTERIKLERKSRQLQAQSILTEFEVEMGIKKPDAVKEAAPFPTESAGPVAENAAEAAGARLGSPTVELPRTSSRPEEGGRQPVPGDSGRGGDRVFRADAVAAAADALGRVADDDPAVPRRAAEAPARDRAEVRCSRSAARCRRTSSSPRFRLRRAGGCSACSSSASGSSRTTRASRPPARGSWPIRRRSSTPCSPLSSGGSGCCRSTTRWPRPRTTARCTGEIARLDRQLATAELAPRVREALREEPRDPAPARRGGREERAEQRRTRRRARLARGAPAPAAAEVGRGDRCHRLLGRDRRRAGAGRGRPRLGRRDGAHARLDAADRVGEPLAPRLRMPVLGPRRRTGPSFRRRRRRSARDRGDRPTCLPRLFSARCPAWAATLARTWPRSRPTRS